MALINKTTMKALRIFAFAAFLAVGSAIAPQTASAYKYWVTFNDGSKYMFHADSKEAAVAKFLELDLQGEHATLSSRPNGGIMGSR